MEMEVVVMVKEENVMPENWRPASEMRALVTSYNNKVTRDLMNETMEVIQEKAKIGATVCYVSSWCETEIANSFMAILETLGYTVSRKYYNGKYTFDIHW